MKNKFLLPLILIGGFFNQHAVGQSTTANNNQNPGLQNRFLGFNNNFPLFTRTFGFNRLKLNETFNAGSQYQIEGYGFGDGVNTSGYLLLGQDNATQQGNPSLYNSKGAFSLLHLNGPQSTFGGGFVQEFGYRPWMKTGITFTGGNDLMYFGIRQTLRGQDKTEMTLTWSDNSGTTFPGPDDMVFRFTSGGNGNTSYSNNLTDPTDLDGQHIARFTGDGNFGLGPTFGDPTINANTVRPASLFHMSRDRRKATWMQITNQLETEQTANDGFRIGFQGGNNRPGLIRWQEFTPLVFQTDWNNNSGGTNAGERMRITTTNFLNTQGQYIGINPGNGNFTRVGISHNGQNPIERPMSLLHLGYDISSSLYGTTADGWRDWMDVGTFTAMGSDNMYVGLKDEGQDRMDAIINWGDNQPTTGGDGPDFLRFIFTSTTSSLFGNGDSISTSNEGLEIMRMDPRNGATYTYNDYGMVGIGNFAANGPNTAAADVIDAKLDIDGDLRIRGLMQNDTLSQYLVIDSTDHNRVYWTSVPPGGGIGHFCSDTITNPLTDSYEIPLADYNYYFEGQRQQVSNVAVGLPCYTPTFSKLHVYQTRRNYLGPISAAGYFHDETTDAVGTGLGVIARANGTNAQNNIAGYFEAQNGAFTNIGVFATADGSVTGNPQTNNNLAAYFDGDVLITGSFGPSDENLKTNIQDYQGGLDIINQLEPKTFEYDHAAYPSMNLSNGLQYGLIAQDVENILPDLVTETNHPETYDSLGNVIHQSISFKGLEYQQLIPVLISGVKELDSINSGQETTIDSLSTVVDSLNNVVNNMNNRLSNLENCLSNILPMLCQMNQSMIQQNDQGVQEQLRSIINVELENGENIVLNQNVPNPFAEQTVITYSIPETVGEAVIMFYDSKGVVIKEVKIETRGHGQLNVYGSDLSRGLYSYTLIADGQVIATKKMVKQ